VREFYFTNAEQEEDAKNFHHVTSLKQILKPMRARISAEE
jgi:hypothetical protein